MNDLDMLKKFILKHRPHVVAVTAQCREAQNVVDDFRFCISQLEQEHQMAPIFVELVDGEVARIYEASPRAEVGNSLQTILTLLGAEAIISACAFAIISLINLYIYI